MTTLGFGQGVGQIVQMAYVVEDIRWTRCSRASGRQRLRGTVRIPFVRLVYSVP